MKADVAEMLEIADPERALAVAYAPLKAREGLVTLLALDERLGGIVARTTEPTIGLMRLVWWRDALAALGAGRPPAEPLLIAAAKLSSVQIEGSTLAGMTEGWEALIDDPSLDEATVACHAARRGGQLFLLAGQLLGMRSDEALRVEAAGEAWARADLARHVSDGRTAERILASARPWIEKSRGGWRRPLRSLGMLAVLAGGDVRRGAGRLRPPASPARLTRILFHQLTGR